MGKDGCFGPAAHLYHQNPPTGWIDWEGTLKPRAFDTTKFADAVDCPWQARLLLGNAHVKYRHLLLTAAMDHLVRNGDGDEQMPVFDMRSEEHTSELQSLMRNSYAVVCLKQKKNQQREV